jgi:DNA-directed RNA polymerase subunit RPC12/RpoP
MSIKIVSVKCPECGAKLDIEEGRKQIFCSYCGAKLLIDNENEYIYRTIDEAGIKQAEAGMKQTEAEHDIRLKQLEIIEKKRASAELTKKIKIIISIVMGIVGIILMLAGAGMAGLVGLLVLEGVMFIWILSDNNKESDDIDFGDKAKVPSSISSYENMNYTAIEEILKSAGFTNIKSIALNDLTTGLLKKPGMVDSIVINGNEVTSGGSKFPCDSSIVISYHSFSKK